MADNYQEKKTMRDYAIFLVQFGAGVILFFMHGYDKMGAARDYVFNDAEWGFVGMLSGFGVPLAGFFAVVVTIVESIVAIMFAVGIFSRTTAILLSINMGVAVIYHISSGQGSFELAAVYLLIFLFVAISGPGQLALNVGFKKKPQA
jgi:putative oxidoreductase